MAPQSVAIIQTTMDIQHQISKGRDVTRLNRRSIGRKRSEKACSKMVRMPVLSPWVFESHNVMGIAIDLLGEFEGPAMITLLGWPIIIPTVKIDVCNDPWHLWPPFVYTVYRVPIYNRFWPTTP